MRPVILCLAALATPLAVVAAEVGEKAATTRSDSPNREYEWPQWRGPRGTGVAPRANPPVEWSESRNVRWKTDLPGLGHSSPIVWRHRVFLTSAVPVGEKLESRYSGAPGAHDNLPVTQRHQFVVLAVDRKSGRIVWEETLKTALPHEGGHYTGSLASASPVTDGEHLFAFFGSQGLYCLNFDGELRWEKDLGRMNSKHGHGEGSSPALHGDTIVVNWDHEGQSSLVALHKSTGKQRWKVPREEVTSWATPIIVVLSGRAQVVVPGTQRMRGYELESGKVVWECGGLSANVVASPVAADGMLFAGSSYEKRSLLALRLEDARGDITGSDKVVWKTRQRTPYVPSPLLYGDALYYLRHYQGIVTRVEARTGKDSPGAFRLGGIRDVYASPVGAAGRVYITDRYGLTLVIEHDDSPEVLARNQLDDDFSASAAVVGGEIFLRGEKYLYCLAETNVKKKQSGSSAQK